MFRYSLLLSLLLLAPLSQASGFVCLSPGGQLRIRLFHHAHAARGTRKAAVMVLSNPQKAWGQRTIAVFSEAEGTLTQESGSFFGEMRVDSPGIANKKNKFVGDIPVENISSIELSPNFSYANPVDSGTLLSASFRMLLVEGRPISGEIACKRYLKQVARARGPSLREAAQFLPPCSRQLEFPMR